MTERYKAMLVAKGHILEEGINYRKFSYFVTIEDLFQVTMMLVVYFDLELYLIIVKMTLLNNDYLPELSRWL